MRATPRKISLSEMTPTSRPGDSTTGKWRKECCVIKLTTSAKVCSGRIVITLRVITSSTRVVLLLPPLSICRSPFFHGIIATSHEVYHADGAEEKQNLKGIVMQLERPFTSLEMTVLVFRCYSERTDAVKTLAEPFDPSTGSG